MSRSSPAQTGGDGDPGKQWMLELQQGDETALRRIVRHYGPRIVSFFRRFGADEDTAEDLAQEALLRIYRARERYEPSARFSTWLHRILHRIAINDGTRNRWRKAVSLEASASGADPADQVHVEELRELVRRAVQALPDRQRTALLLNRFEGLSYEDVGQVLGMKVPAVKSLLFRARENVKNLLTPLLREERSHELSRSTALDH